MKTPTIKSRFLNKLRPLLLALLMLPVAVMAQDLGLWTGVSTDYQLSKSLALHANAQVRFSDNIQVTRAYLGELGLSYKLTKHLKVSGFYRYTGRLKLNRETETWYYRPYHRFYGELSYDQKLGKFLKLDYRLRYQNQFKDDNDAVVADKSYLRNKLELSFRNSSRFTPFVSADLFYRIDQGDGSRGFDQVRYKAGTNIQIAKAHSLDIFIFTNAPLGDNTEPMTPILGSTYKLKLGRAKGKTKDKL